MAKIKFSEVFRFLLWCSDSGPHSIGRLFTDQMALYYMKGLYHRLFGIYHITGKRRKGKGSKVPCQYIYYNGFTNNLTFHGDLAFIFVIMLFSQPLNKIRYLYDTGHNSRQYGMYLYIS